MAGLTDMAGWLHHIVITVSDLGVSTQFYDEVLTLIGFRRIRDVPEGPLWAGERIEVGLQEARSGHARNHDRYSPGLHHLAFGAPDHAAVDRMYQALVDCNARIRSDAVGRIAVDPLHGFGRAVVLADVAHELALEIGHGGEDAAGDDIALDLGEPEFNLVEPGRVRRGVV